MKGNKTDIISTSLPTMIDESKTSSIKSGKATTKIAIIKRPEPTISTAQTNVRKHSEDQPLESAKSKLDEKTDNIPQTEEAHNNLCATRNTKFFTILLVAISLISLLSLLAAHVDSSGYSGNSGIRGSHRSANPGFTSDGIHPINPPNGTEPTDNPE